jgi:hypothetical protein
MQTVSKLARRRGVAEIMGDSFSIFLSDWRAFLLLSLIAMPLTLLDFGVGIALAGRPAIVLVSLVLTVPLSAGVHALVNGLYVSRILRTDTGAHGTVKPDIERVRASAGTLFVATFRANLIATLLVVTVIGSPWGMSRYVRWSFVTQAVIVDGQYPETALAHSSGVVAGNWWRTLGRTFALSMVVFAVTLPFTAANYLTGHDFLRHSNLTVLVPQTILSALVAPYVAIGETLSYLDLKLRKSEPISNSDDLPA